MQVKDFYLCLAHSKLSINVIIIYHVFSSSPLGFLLTPTFNDSKNHLDKWRWTKSVGTDMPRFIYIFKILFLLLIVERGREGERGRKTSM